MCRTTAAIDWPANATKARTFGRLSSVTDGVGTTHFRYDDYGRVVRSYLVRSTPSESYARTREFNFDAAGRLVTTRYPTGRLLEYVNDGVDPDYPGGNQGAAQHDGSRRERHPCVRARVRRRRAPAAPEVRERHPPGSAWDPAMDCVGYVVARVPEDAYDHAGNPAFPSRPVAYGDIVYSGVDRLDWFDLDEAHYDGTLPSDLEDFRRRLRKANADGTGLLVSKSLKEVKRVVSFCETRGARCEIMVVASPSLGAIKGTVGSPVAVVSWLGYDAFLLGAWSLLCDGVFRKPQAFARWLPALNSSGLLREPGLAAGLLADYKSAMLQGEVEPILGDDRDYPLEAVRVGRLLQANLAQSSGDSRPGDQ